MQYSHRMRRLVLFIGAISLVGATFALSPYELEVVAEHVVSNPTGCTVDVQNYSGWRKGRAALALPAERVADPIDAYVFVSGCPGVPDGRPVALALASGGETPASEDCGAGLRTGGVCRVRIPDAPRGYRLRVQVQERDKPQWVEIDVRRDREWRSGLIDAIMSV